VLKALGSREPLPEIDPDEEGDRPTLVPAFDVSRLARDSNRWNASRSGVHPVARAPSPPADGSIHLRAADVYLARIGSLYAKPVLLVPLARVPRAHRAHCEGFLLCRIDGVASLAEIIAASTLPELTALSLVCDLLDARIIAFAKRRG
jgi:hypothetical protein